MMSTPANENVHTLSPRNQHAPSLSVTNDAAAREKLVTALMSEVYSAQRSGMSAQMAQETLLALSVSVFVNTLGRDVAATLIDRLPEKVRSGSFGNGTPIAAYE